MAYHSYLNLVDHYYSHKKAIDQMIESIISSLNQSNLLDDAGAQRTEVNHLSKAYPFIEMLYSLDANGIQLLDSTHAHFITEPRRRTRGEGSDRSHRPYYLHASQQKSRMTVTEPYLSNATHRLALSAVIRFDNADGTTAGYLVLNLNLQKLISYLNHDQLRYRFHPFFQAVYAIIGLLLLAVAGILLWASFDLLLNIFRGPLSVATDSFGVVILITLGLAIFDLGKTILEEEVFVHKDIHHHGSTERTITRFMSAILIAVSIEALLLMFKSLLGDADQLTNAVLMMFSAVALLIGLAIYLKLTRTELTKSNPEQA